MAKPATLNDFFTPTELDHTFFTANSISGVLQIQYLTVKQLTNIAYAIMIREGIDRFPESIKLAPFAIHWLIEKASKKGIQIFN